MSETKTGDLPRFTENNEAAGVFWWNITLSEVIATAVFSSICKSLSSIKLWVRANCSGDDL